MSDEDVLEEEATDIIAEEFMQSHKDNEAVAVEVLAGHWGRGNKRTQRLRDAGYDPKGVYQEIDRILHR